MRLRVDGMTTENKFKNVRVDGKLLMRFRMKTYTCGLGLKFVISKIIMDSCQPKPQEHILLNYTRLNYTKTNTSQQFDKISKTKHNSNKKIKKTWDSS